MSWDKNTLNLSEVDSVMNTLRDLGEPFVLHVLGEVQGNGLNDDAWEGEGEDAHPVLKMYQIRKLEYKNVVLLEQMQRHPDCDVDDVILSFKFDKIEEPKEWKIEIMLQDPDYDEPDPYYDEYPEDDYPCDCDSCNGEEE
jgi:hypothetical protein